MDINRAKIEISKLYIATLNRLPENGGLAYWSSKIVNDGWSIESIAQSFFDQPETQALYPASIATTDFVTAVYQNILSREPDSGGLAYWANEIESGSVSKQYLIIAMINAANEGSDPLDQALLANRADVGIYFADKGINNVELARDLVQKIDSDSTSKASTEHLINNYDALTHDGDGLDLNFFTGASDSVDVFHITLKDNVTLSAQGLGGNDIFHVSDTSAVDSLRSTLLLGGTGDDQYNLDTSGAYIIYDSQGTDSIRINASFDQFSAATINDGNDLVILNDFAGILLPDWKGKNKIEQFMLNDATYTHEFLVQAVSTNGLGDFADKNLAELLLFPTELVDPQIDLFTKLGNMSAGIETELGFNVPTSVNSSALADLLL